MENSAVQEKDWNNLVNKLSKQFDADLDIQGILFLIGVQELGQGPRKYSKKEKMDIMHIATCSILEPYGYYEFLGEDEDGWPHFEDKGQMPKLNSGQQLKLMKQAILDYFERNDAITG